MFNPVHIELHSRQSAFVPPIIGDIGVLVIGAGGVGSNAADMLAATGVRHFTVFDPDAVGVENLYAQRYNMNQVGQPKVHALADALAGYGDVMVKGRQELFTGREVGDAHFDVIILGTDTMASRVAIWENLQPTYDLFIDARMGSRDAEVFAFVPADEKARQHYNEECLIRGGYEHEAPCGDKATAFMTKGLIAGTITQYVLSWLNGQAISFETIINGKSMRLVRANL